MIIKQLVAIVSVTFLSGAVLAADAELPDVGLDDQALIAELDVRPDYLDTTNTASF